MSTTSVSRPRFYHVLFQFWDGHLDLFELSHNVLNDGQFVDLVEPAKQVRILDSQNFVEDPDPEEQLAHDKNIGKSEMVADQEFPVLQVVVETLAAGVEHAQAVLGVFAYALMAADERQNHAANCRSRGVSSHGHFSMHKRLEAEDR